MRRSRAGFCAGLTSLALSIVTFAVTADAHSILLHATPSPGTRVRAPSRVTLRFNNRIEKRLSRVRLVDERGGTRDLAVAEDGAADWLTAGVPAITPGRYRVEWQVLSTDGHVVAGRFTFTVTP